MHLKNTQQIFLNHHFKIIDISPTISEKLAVFPGDKNFKRFESMSTVNGDLITLSSIESTLHIGAHTDAPIHYHKHGETIEKRSLHFYLGPCQVIELEMSESKIITADIIRQNNLEISAERILLKTMSFPRPEKWNNDFISLSSCAIDLLHSLGVILIGIDTPSVDFATSKTLDAHHTIYQYNMSILEGIVLEHVFPGHYFLIAPPLKIQDGDAAPTRAILLQQNQPK